jgi:hypothetical protein
VAQRVAIGLVSFVLGLWGASPAAAVPFQLNVEFDLGTPGNFGTVDITENAGDLDFVITLNASLGAGRDLQEFYFNLASGITGLAISSTDVVNTAYTLIADPAEKGGAGAQFDFGVNFGDGAGPSGNSQLTSATFTLSADQALSIADLLIASDPNATGPVYFALHAQGTSLTTADSETVGALVPEPTTLALVLAGLAGLAAGAPRRASRS